MTRSPRFILPFVLWLGCTSAPRGNNTPDDVPSDADDAMAMEVGADAGDVPSQETAVETGVDAAPDVAPDAGPDAGPDAAPDVGPDATPDVTADATPDATVDVAPDAAADAAVDAPRDATPDATLDVAADVTPDAAADASADVAADRTDAAVDAVVCVPATETCNGRDDDCDGIVDESDCGAHLLITEVVVGPTEAEFIEIHNPTSAPVVLSNYYLSDNHDYACFLGRTCTITGRTVATAVDSSDFVARFPDGATIPARGHVVVTTASPMAFAGIHGGRCPDFYLPAGGLMPDGGAVPLGPCTAAVAMRSATMAGTIGRTAGLTNGGEPAVLFRWDGVAPLVTDVDYVFWGATSTTNLAVDKTGTAAMGAMYLPDTVAAMQQRTTAPGNGAAAIRCNYAETGERMTGGNGVGGHDETSEPLMTTWRTTTAPVVPDGGVLTSVTATPGALNDCR